MSIFKRLLGDSAQNSAEASATEIIDSRVTPAVTTSATPEALYIEYQNIAQSIGAFDIYDLSQVLEQLEKLLTISPSSRYAKDYEGYLTTHIQRAKDTFSLKDLSHFRLEYAQQIREATPEANALIDRTEKLFAAFKELTHAEKDILRRAVLVNHARHASAFLLERYQGAIQAVIDYSAVSFDLPMDSASSSSEDIRIAAEETRHLLTIISHLDPLSVAQGNEQPIIDALKNLTPLQGVLLTDWRYFAKAVSDVAEAQVTSVIEAHLKPHLERFSPLANTAKLVNIDFRPSALYVGGLGYHTRNGMLQPLAEAYHSVVLEVERTSKKAVLGLDLQPDELGRYYSGGGGM